MRNTSGARGRVDGRERNHERESKCRRAKGEMNCDDERVQFCRDRESAKGRLDNNECETHDGQGEEIGVGTEPQEDQDHRRQDEEAREDRDEAVRVLDGD